MGQHEPIPVLEIGGTHVSAVLVSPEPWALVPGSLTRVSLNANGPADQLLDVMATAAGTLGHGHQSNWAVAIPGPFDYARGIGLFRDVGKFESLRGVDVRRGLISRIAPRPSRVHFLNDADAFGVGEYAVGAARGHDRAVCITLGTGVGSAFLDRGEPVNAGPLVPPEGSIHLVLHDGRPLEETVSRRAIRAAYAAAAGQPVEAPDVHTIAERCRAGDRLAHHVLRHAFLSLGATLAPILERFEASILVIGGSVAGSWDVVAPAIRDGLSTAQASVDLLVIRPAERASEAALLGAACWSTHQP